MKNKIKTIILLSLLIMAAIVLTGCDLFRSSCRGNGQCSITIIQGDGLLLDTTADNTHCGDTGSWDNLNKKYNGGCTAANMRYIPQKAGTHKCDC